jgi:hypothetical protein
MIFIESKAFTKAAQELLSEEEILELQKRLLQNPQLGVVIPGTRSLRKLRLRLQARGKGKRGGARIIYYFLQRKSHLHLLLLYSKGKKDDLTPQEIKILNALVEEIEKA